MHCLPLSLPALFCCYLNDVALSGILPFCFQQCLVPTCHINILQWKGKEGGGREMDIEFKRKLLKLTLGSQARGCAPRCLSP